MRNPLRLTALVAAAAMLLAAGEAPNGDLSFLNDIPSAPVSATADSAFELIETEHDYSEPDLGLILPEAGSLSQMVSEVRGASGIEMNQDLQCLATTVYYESKGEPLDGQLAVAQVVLNRVEDGRFGRDICGVVKAPKQFSFVSGGQLPTPTNTDQWETAKAVALIALGGGWKEVVPDATHFHATRVSPGWRLTRVATVGRHIFYR